MSSNKTEVSLGIDNGTTFCAVSVRRGRKTTRMTFPGVGAQLPSAVYCNPDGSILVGNAARNAAYRDPSRLYTHFKRGIVPAADQPWNGGPTPVELTGHLLAHIWDVVLKVNPDVKDYVAALGGKRGPEGLRIALTHPATFHLEAQAALMRAVDGVGNGFRVDTQISEPVAGSFVFREQCGDRLKRGDLLAVIDVGGGTTDCCVLQFNGGAFDQVVGAKGDDELGGLNFTGRVFNHFCRELLGAEMPCFRPSRGLDLADASLTDADRRLASQLWQKAEDCKHELSVQEDATVFVEMPGGLQELPLSRQQFLKICATDGDLWQRFDVAVADTLEGSSYRWADIQHVILIGGSALLPGLVGRVACVTGRPEGALFVSSDSTHVVADGAAYQSFFQENTAHCLAGGLGVQLRDALRPNQVHNKFFFGTGEAIPADGRTIEQLGQRLKTRGGPCTIRLALVESKPGIHVPVPDGNAVLLSESEVVPVKQLALQAVLPPGEHDVQVGFQVDAAGQLRYRVSFPRLPQVDVISGRVGDDQQGQGVTAAYNLLMLLDCSGSMLGQQIESAKQALLKLQRQLVNLDVRLGLVTFGSATQLAAPLGTSFQTMERTIQGITAGGGTPMDEALRIAREHVGLQPPDRKPVVVMATDGAPYSVDATIAQADSLKQIADLVCIGIGQGVAADFLINLASTPRDYFFADDADQLGGIFETILNLYLDPSLGVAA